MIRLTGLWLNTAASTNEKYFRGALGSAVILIYKNNRKQSDKDPDYILYLDESKKPQVVADFEDPIQAGNEALSALEEDVPQ